MTKKHDFFGDLSKPKQKNWRIITTSFLDVTVLMMFWIAKMTEKVAELVLLSILGAK